MLSVPTLWTVFVINFLALGLIWAPNSGFTAHGEVRYTGSRYLNRRNTALAPSFEINCDMMALPTANAESYVSDDERPEM